MKVIDWMLSRLREPSTFAGFASLAIAAGLTDAQWATIAAGVAGVAGIVAMLLSDGQASA